MKKTTYHDPAVIALTETLVPIYVDVDNDAGVSDQYSVEGIPTYVLLKPDGTEGGRMAGYHDAREFVEAIKAALQ